MLDIDKLTNAMVDHTVKAIDKATAPLISRIADLEKALDEQPAPADVDEKAIAEAVMLEIAPTLDRIKEFEPAAAPELPDIPALVDAAVAVAMIEVPTPVEIDAAKVAEDAAALVAERLDQIQAIIDEMPEIEAPELPELPDIRAMVGDAVKSAVGELPAPEPGKSVTVDDVLPELKSHVAELVAALPAAERGSDGVGLAGAFIDRSGELTVTLTNGETRGLGKIVGKDGDPGIGFDDLDVDHDGERTFTLRFQRGARVIEKTLTIPAILDRGVFSEGKDYDQGDAVSFGGSMWVAQKKTGERPGTGDGWRLAVKKGRDGKDGELKEPPKGGPVKVS